MPFRCIIIKIKPVRRNFTEEFTLPFQTPASLTCLVSTMSYEDPSRYKCIIYVETIGIIINDNECYGTAADYLDTACDSDAHPWCAGSGMGMAIQYLLFIYIGMASLRAYVWGQTDGLDCQYLPGHLWTYWPIRVVLHNNHFLQEVTAFCDLLGLIH